MKKLLTALACTALLGTLASGARADGVNFEDKTGPSTFAAAGPTQTLVYSFPGYTATFAGGVVLTDETSQTTDFSSVYATAYFGDPSLTNPLTVTFSSPIHNFQIDILNALSGHYEMFDNVGDTVFFSLAVTGGSAQTEGFAAAGTQVSVLYLDGAQDFAIDNVTFNQPLSAVPEASMPALLLAGLGVVGVAARRRRQAA